MAKGRINVYISEEIQHALRVAAVENRMTIGQYLMVMLADKFNIKVKQHPDEVQARSRVKK